MKNWKRIWFDWLLFFMYVDKKWWTNVTSLHFELCLSGVNNDKDDIPNPNIPCMKYHNWKISWKYSTPGSYKYYSQIKRNSTIHHPKQENSSTERTSSFYPTSRFVTTWNVLMETTKHTMWYFFDMMFIFSILSVIYVISAIRLMNKRKTTKFMMKWTETFMDLHYSPVITVPPLFTTEQYHNLLDLILYSFMAIGVAIICYIYTVIDKSSNTPHGTVTLSLAFIIYQNISQNLFNQYL